MNICLQFPGSGGYSLLLIQEQDEDTKQCSLRRRILIVDDELDITFTFKMILEENGFSKQVDTFNDTHSLTEFSGVYGLLIIDIAMPVMDGFRLYQLMKQIDNKPNVLFATAYQLNYEVLRIFSNQR
jgi:DNA-binding response OmpR family regulator